MPPTLRQLYGLGPRHAAALRRAWLSPSRAAHLRCYNYAAMVVRGYIAPGTALRPLASGGLMSPSSWTPFAPYTPQSLHAALLHDGFLPLSVRKGQTPQPPADSFLIAALFGTDPDTGLNDIHALRHHPAHGFSHKWGEGPVMFADLSGHRIDDPRRADLGYFTRFVGFYHAPLDGLPGHRDTGFIDKPGR